MILVDSSVWIDYFRGGDTPQVDTLHLLLGTEPLATGDLILTEVLQGFTSDADFARARKLLMSLTIVHPEEPLSRSGPRRTFAGCARSA